MRRQPFAPRIGQRAPSAGFLRDVCRSTCPMYESPSTTSPIIGTYTNGTPMRLVRVLPDGWSQVQIEGVTNGRQVKTGFVRTVLLRAPGIFQPGPLRPDIDLTRPQFPDRPPPNLPVPLPVDPAPASPPPAGDPNAPAGSPGGTMGTALAARSITQTIGEVILLTSPAWGAFLLSRYLR